ncbi:MAG: ABC transporter permease [Bacteroidales bacterium]
MILIIKLIRESAVFALSSIVANKLRTLLTLLGITIGIFAIISVFSAVDALERQIRSSISALGDNVVYIQKWPWQFGNDYQWWQYMNRPVPQYKELAEIERRTSTVEAAVFMVSANRTVEHLNNSIESVTLLGVSAGYEQVRNFEMDEGRFFSMTESAAGRSVAVLGYDIAHNLFPGTDPVGQSIKVYGRYAEVIGVFAKEGTGGFGNTLDETVVLPLFYISQFIDINSDRHGPVIMTKAYAGISNQEMIDDLTGTMRSIRRIKPMGEDDFALNETSLISQGFDGLFAIITLAGWIIGGFSILVGGFGIANIMFVSVRERTTIIGIQKALGAKNYFVLLQFLFEAIMLSLIGGIIGLVLVLIASAVVSAMTGMDFVLTAENILLGINVSAIIGLVSGFIPAWTASRLDPVEAIRSNG